MKRMKKLLIGFSMCMILAGGISRPETIQAAEDGFIIENEILSENSMSNSVISGEDTGTENDFIVEDEIISQNKINGIENSDRATSNGDFDIENGVLEKYNGSGGNIVIPDGVREIGNGAFWGCNNLTSISIPSGVSYMDNIAFLGCDSLYEINVNIGNPSYSSEDGIVYNKDKTVLMICPGGKTNVSIIPKSVTEIGFGAFSGSTSLRSVVIPSSVIKIGESAFNQCKNLTNIVIPNSVTEIGDYTFFDTPWLDLKREERADHLVIINNNLIDAQKASGDVVIPDGIISIKSSAFGWCQNLTNVVIPNSVTEIGFGAFAFCQNLKNITIPNSVISISCGAFYHCENLFEITILNPNTKLKYSESSGNSILEDPFDITEFKNSIVTIKGFANSTAQELADYMNNKPHYKGKTTFKFVPLDESQNPGTVTPSPSIPKPGKTTPNKGTILTSGNNTYKVTKKGSEVAFTKTSSTAKSVNIPNTVKIDDVDYKVTSIASNAFKGNKTLSKVTINKNITSIGKNAFSGCVNLKTITIKSTKLKSVGQNAFKSVKSTAQIKVPAKKLKAYKKLLKGKGLAVSIF